MDVVNPNTPMSTHRQVSSSDRDNALAAIKASSRIALGHYPTPIEPAMRISKETGSKIWLKREDLCGLGAGGNKIRKLEVELARPEAMAADVFISTGGWQSNHAREVAAAGARLGKEVELFLKLPDEGGPIVGNALLQRLFGANVHAVQVQPVAGGAMTGDEIVRAMDARQAEIVAEGRSAHVIALGVGNWAGVVGWAQGMIEFVNQADAIGEPLDAVVCAAGTASTVVGLGFGAAALGLDLPVYGISVSHTEDELVEIALDLSTETCERLGLSGFESEICRNLKFSDAFVGAGYGKVTEDGQAAVSRLAREFGVAADLTYSGKGFSGLLHMLDAGKVEKGSTVGFLHTGGQPELFTREPEVVLSAGSTSI